jgi:hypothetical protein
MFPNRPMMRFLAVATLLLAASSALRAQDGTIVYRLGRDTVAVEQYSKTPTSFRGEMVTRGGAAVTRLSYDFTLANGRVTRATVKRMQADGTPIANAPIETRYVFTGDSVKRDLVFRDSTANATPVAARFIAFPVFAYAPFELVYGGALGSRDSIRAVAINGNGVSQMGLVPAGGDTLRMRGGPYAMLIHFDRNGAIDRIDGTNTTNKMVATRTPGRVDIAALAAKMRPAGVLSPRATAYAAFMQGPIFINYSRPAVRERTVWGGTLVPFDSIWRVGANEAAHLATSKTMMLGDMTLAPGLYSIWIQHTRDATWLIVNKQVGQWGTAYRATEDIGRVKLESSALPDHVEDFTINVRSLGTNRGAIDFQWEKTQMTATFTIR